MNSIIRIIEGIDFDAASAEDYVNRLGARLAAVSCRADAPGWTPETEVERRLLASGRDTEWKSVRHFVIEKDDRQYLFREAFCKDPYDDDDKGFQAASLEAFCHLSGKGLCHIWSTWVPDAAQRVSAVLRRRRLSRRLPVTLEPAHELTLEKGWHGETRVETIRVTSVRPHGISFTVVTDDGREMRVEDDRAEYDGDDVETSVWDEASLAALEGRLNALRD